MKKNIEKLEIDLFGEFEGKTLEQRYNEERIQFISESERYVQGYSNGLFGWRNGYYEKTPEVGKIEWEKRYPNGIEDWKTDATKLNAIGEQIVIDKINEIIDFISSQKKK